MKSLSNEMTIVDWPLKDEELVEYILIGLNDNYLSLVSVVCIMKELIIVNELFTQFLNFETHVCLVCNSIFSPC